MELCEGLAGFRPDDRILIKPNLVEWDLDLPFPPWGVVTTSAVLGALVEVLAERGFRKLTLGEGTPLPHRKGKGRKVFGLLGYERLRERYGVELVDFDEEPFDDVDLGGLTLSVARRALEADKIVTVPTLKTHGICRVSLGIKNLKGCISRKSKQFCHSPERQLDHTFPLLLERLPVALNLIDGVYALERGPTHSGRAYRRDLLVASSDVFAADLVGAQLLGYEGAEIPHLLHYGQRQGRSADVGHVEVRGESLEAHKRRLEWDTPWREDGSAPAAFDKLGITGLSFRKPDETVCTHCVCAVAPALVMLMSAYGEGACGTVEVITGKKTLASEGFDRTVLLGKCASALNEGNPNIKRRLALKTCPPRMEDFPGLLQEAGVDCRPEGYEEFRRRAFNRYKEADGFLLSLYGALPCGEATKGGGEAGGTESRASAVGSARAKESF